MTVYVCVCRLLTASWYLSISPHSISYPWGKKFSEVSPRTKVPKGWKVKWKELRGFISSKRDIQLHPPAYPGSRRWKGSPPQRKATQEWHQPQQRTLMTSLWRYLEPRGPQRSDEEKAWHQTSPPGQREWGCKRCLAAGSCHTTKLMGLQACPCLEALQLRVKCVINLSSSAWGWKCHCTWWCLGALQDPLPPPHMCQQPPQGGQVSLVTKTRQENKARPTKDSFSGISGVQSTAFCLLGTFDFLTHIV